MSLFVVAKADTSHYVKECLDGGNPYNSFSTVENLIEKVDICLARAYISFPQEFRTEFEEQIQTCINSIRENERSKPEYRTLEREVAQLTSNSADSIIETQHVMSQLVVCTESLKVIANADVYEETRFDSLANKFEYLLHDTNVCIEGGVAHVQEQVDIVDTRLAMYELKYEQWLNMTKSRQEATEKCHEDIEEITQKVHRHILRELHS